MATSAVALHGEGRSTATVLTTGGWSFNTIDRDHGNSRQANNEKVGLIIKPSSHSNPWLSRLTTLLRPHDTISSKLSFTQVRENIERVILLPEFSPPLVHPPA